MYQVNAHPPYFREEENETKLKISTVVPEETESCDYDFQWQCDLFYFEKDRQDVYAWKLPAFFCLSF